MERLYVYLRKNPSGAPAEGDSAEDTPERASVEENEKAEAAAAALFYCSSLAQSLRSTDSLKRTTTFHKGTSFAEKWLKLYTDQGVKKSNLWRDLHEQNTLGIAFSGGGVRAAASVSSCSA